MLNIHSDLVQKEMATLGANAFCVLLAISSHISPLKRDCFPSRARIKKMTGLGDEAVRNAIKKLSENGYLKMNQSRSSGAFDKTIYTITTPHIGVFMPINQMEVVDSPDADEPDAIQPGGGQPHPVEPDTANPLLSISNREGISKVLLEKEPKESNQPPSIPTNKKEKLKKNTPLPPSLPDREHFAGFANPDMAMEIWAEWVKYKKEQHRFSYKSEDSMTLGIAKLLTYSGGSIQKARAIIHDAMANGYKGFFEYNDKIAASAIVPPQKIPEDTHPLPAEMLARYEATTRWFHDKCSLCTGIRWLSKAEYEKIQNKDEDFIGPMWYVHCKKDKYLDHVKESTIALNQLPRWEKDKWQSVYEWLKKDVSDRIFPNNNP